MTKKIIGNCYDCKRYHIKPYDTPTPGQVKKARTIVIRAFQVIGLNFAGSIMYKKWK